MRQIAILGSTGSIGRSTLAVIAQHPDRYRVVALAAQRSVDVLFEQCRQCQPHVVVLQDAEAAEDLSRRLQAADMASIRVEQGAEAVTEIARMDGVDTVMAAIVGAAGLAATLAAARAGKRVLLANKEALVMSGQLFMDEVYRHGAELLPIDSEHNALFQCLPRQYPEGLAAVGVERLILTASGGPFREMPLEQLATITPEQACAHPVWQMGRKISVDSATLMNKGLEVIEACWLFGADLEQVEVLIHPQSVIHSLVEYRDGSVLAQLGSPDMRTPIAHALAWPERITAGVSRLDLVQVACLDFQAPDLQRFPCLSLAYQAWRAGGTAPAVLNAANEVAVEAFLAGRLAFDAIARVIESALECVNVTAATSLETVLASDAEARHIARHRCETL